MRITLKELKTLIRGELQEAGFLKKALATAATAAALGATVPAYATSTEEPGTHPAVVGQEEERDPQARMSFREVAPLIRKASQRYGVDAALIDAMIQTESNYRPNVVSHAGAIGMMQLMPATAEWLGVEDPYDPEQNIMGGAKFLRWLLKRFNNDISLAVAAYNAGPSAVIRHKGIPPYKETQAYVKRVLERIESSRFK